MERKDVVLNNGVTMPPIGYGVFRMTNLEEGENHAHCFGTDENIQKYAG